MTPPLLLQKSIDELKERLRYNTRTLHPEFKVELLKELRSGQYHRTTGKLIDCEGDCCLMGIAAKVMERRGIVRIEDSDEDSCHAIAMEVIDIATGGSCHGTIPQAAASLVGLTAYLQEILSSFNDNTPVADNDTLFAEAADLIEEYL